MVNLIGAMSRLQKGLFTYVLLMLTQSVCTYSM
uniref:Uncharacterized protein n=1 Tax=Rhizophora mucronata TaxID=61149 RepID=A0A2P2PZS9_RHIMU